jgi:hypothetical protein
MYLCHCFVCSLVSLCNVGMCVWMDVLLSTAFLQLLLLLLLLLLYYVCPKAGFLTETLVGFSHPLPPNI